MDLSRLRPAVGRRERCADKRPPPALGFQVSQHLQFVIGFFDGERCNDELLAQIAARGQPGTAFERTSSNRFDDLPHDLAVDRDLIGGVDLQMHK